eukprot:jgi/Botrbrau1/11293/Bobra.0038s0059.1
MGSGKAKIRLTHYPPEVYEPSDDTFALADALEESAPLWTKSPPTLCVEVGCGSGFVTATIALLLRQAGCVSLQIATDISSAALEATDRTLHAHEVEAVELIQADLVLPLLPQLKSCIDLLVFNPPYVVTPDEEVRRGGIASAWAGGRDGRLVIDRLLPLVGQLLSAEGHFFLVTVKDNRPEEILEMMFEQGLAGKVALQRSADEERLVILHCWRPT